MSNAQYSIVHVNGIRMTSSAGGQGDGEGAGDGALITAGGVGDSYDSPPDPYACATSATTTFRSSTLAGMTTSSTVCSRSSMMEIGASPFATSNPSGDDNLLFAALDVRGAAAIIESGNPGLTRIGHHSRGTTAHPDGHCPGFLWQPEPERHGSFPGHVWPQCGGRRRCRD